MSKPTVGTIVRVLVRRVDHILLVQSRSLVRANAWQLPGGKKKRKETVREAGIRELQEETSLKLVQAHKLVDWKRETSFKTKWRFVVFEARHYTGVPTILDEEEINDIGWFLPRDLPRLDEESKALLRRLPRTHTTDFVFL